MNLLLFDLEDVRTDGRIRIFGERADHIRRILKATPGTRLAVGQMSGKIGSAVVASVGREYVELEAPQLDRAPPVPLSVTLALALPRPKFLGRILQDASAFGIKEIVLFGSARVEKSYWSSRVLRPEAIDRHLRLGLQQARDTVLPAVRLERSWSTLCRDRLAGSARPGPLWVAEGSATEPFPATPATPATVLIGPEGGLLDDELSELRELGASFGHLGPRALRVETAVAAVLSRFLASEEAAGGLS